MSGIDMLEVYVLSLPLLVLVGLFVYARWSERRTARRIERMTERTAPLKRRLLHGR